MDDLKTLQDNARGERHVISDDCLFPLPKDMSTWDGCVRVWNSALSFESRWKSILNDAICSGNDGAFETNAFLFWDKNLPLLIARLNRARCLMDEAVEKACRIRYGFGMGSVLQFPPDNSLDDDSGLAYMTLGGLPLTGEKPELRFFFQAVHEFNGGYITANSGMNFLNRHPDSFMDGVIVRNDIKPIKPGDSPVHSLPLEVFDDELMKSLRDRICPSGFESDRKSVLFAFWNETLQMQKNSNSKFKDGDIILVKGRAKRCFHVVYVNGGDQEQMACYNPLLKHGNDSDAIRFMSISYLRTSTHRFELALPASDFGSVDRLSSSESMMLAMLETTRMRLADPRLPREKIQNDNSTNKT